MTKTIFDVVPFINNGYIGFIISFDDLYSTRY